MNLMRNELDFSSEPALTPNTDPYALAKALSGRHLIGGKLVPASSGNSFEVIDPATGTVIGYGAEGDEADVNLAVEDAAAAQKEWGKMRARDRGALIHKCGEVLMDHVEELGRLIALETGKALRTESRVEASILADVPCRPRFRAQGRNRSAPSGHADHHRARAGRRCRCDHSVERAAAADGAENRSGTGRR